MSNVNPDSWITIDWPEYGVLNIPADLIGEVRISGWDYTLYSLRTDKKVSKPVVILVERVDGTRRSMVSISRGKARRFTISGAFRYLAALAQE